jgi:hypothetical protein
LPLLALVKWLRWRFNGLGADSFDKCGIGLVLHDIPYVMGFIMPLSGLAC